MTRFYPRKMTDRRRQILGLVARGLTNDEIARELVIERKTVETHIRDIGDVLDVPGGKQALLLYAVEEERKQVKGLLKTLRGRFTRPDGSCFPGEQETVVAIDRVLGVVP